MNVQLDRACRMGSRSVESFCHRTFYPRIETRSFDYPGTRATALKVWLDDWELIEATSVTSDGVTIPPTTGYLLRPNSGPPYDRIEIQRDSAYSFAGGPQNAITIVGLPGYRNDESTLTALASAVSTPAATTIDVDNPADVGSVIRIDSERMQVLGKTWTASAVNCTALTANASSNSITTTDSENFTVGERILIDAERLEVLDIAGDTVILRRAVDGSALAAHANGTGIYWQHRLTVERGALGTTAATHLDNAVVYRWEPPSQVQVLSLAYAEDSFLQENSGYARLTGQGENERPVGGRGIKDAENRCRHLVRSSRSRTV